MKARIQKWGNSLALRIPKSFAVETGLYEDAPVELSCRDGKIVIQLAPKAPPTLDELLREVTEENLHDEWPTGSAVGRETW